MHLIPLSVGRNFEHIKVSSSYKVISKEQFKNKCLLYKNIKDTSIFSEVQNPLYVVFLKAVTLSRETLRENALQPLFLELHLRYTA